MENVNEEKIVIEDEDIKEEDFSEDELNDETIDWKAKALELKGLNKRRATKLRKFKEAQVKESSKPEIKPNPEKPVKEGFDYAELAYLTAKGISDDDISFVEDTVKDTGKSLKDLLGAKWFQEELKDKQQERASKEAIPTGSNRAGSSAKDEVDYWIAKGEMPKNNPELARKVLKAREKAEIDHSKFTDTPVIS